MKLYIKEWSNWKLNCQYSGGINLRNNVLSAFDMDKISNSHMVHNTQASSVDTDAKSSIVDLSTALSDVWKWLTIMMVNR